jgi:hypothetical protein
MIFQKLSIIIPAYNEGKTIHFILNKLQNVILLNSLVNLVALNVNNNTNKIKQDETNIDLIISNTYTPFILINGFKYWNQNNVHAYIWLYKR